MANTDSAPHLLVVIDHQEAKVYRTEIDGAEGHRFLLLD